MTGSNVRARRAPIALACALALLGAPLAALARAPRCTAPRDSVEQMICSSTSPGRLHAQVSEAYAAALTRDVPQASLIEADQANWRAERDDLARYETGGFPGNSKFAIASLTDLYRERIAFLDSLGGGAGARDDPRANDLLHAMTADARGGSRDVLKTLRMTGTVSPPWTRRLPYAYGGVLANLPAPASPKLRAAIRKYSSSPGFDLAVDKVAYFPAERLGGLLYLGGSAGCRSWVMFRKRGNELHLVDTPKPLASACTEDGTSTSTNQLDLLAGEPIAIKQTISNLGYQTDLLWQRWTGPRWAKPVQITTRYPERLFPFEGGIACAATLSMAECDRAQREVMAIAKRYAQRPLSGTLARDVTLTGAEQARFEAMRAAAQRTGYPGEGIPSFGTGLGVGVGAFSRHAATWFPSRLDGKLVLGRIGHGTYSSDEIDPNWLVALSGWRDGKLVPLVGAVVGFTPGNGLLAAQVPFTPRQ